jgi:hypothetical protein
MKVKTPFDRKQSLEWSKSKKWFFITAKLFNKVNDKFETSYLSPKIFFFCQNLLQSKSIAETKVLW